MLQYRVSNFLMYIESQAMQNVREKSTELFNNFMQMQPGFYYVLNLKTCEIHLGATAR